MLKVLDLLVTSCDACLSLQEDELVKEMEAVFLKDFILSGERQEEDYSFHPQSGSEKGSWHFNPCGEDLSEHTTESISA